MNRLRCTACDDTRMTASDVLPYLQNCPACYSTYTVVESMRDGGAWEVVVGKFPRASMRSALGDLLTRLAFMLCLVPAILLLAGAKRLGSELPDRLLFAMCRHSPGFAVWLAELAERAAIGPSERVDDMEAYASAYQCTQCLYLWPDETDPELTPEGRIEVRGQSRTAHGALCPRCGPVDAEWMRGMSVIELASLARERAGAQS